jgi:hypothetical protein
MNDRGIPDPSEAWADLLGILRARAGRPRQRRAAALLVVAEKLAGSERWARLYPALLGSELWLAPAPRAGWRRGVPKVSVRYVSSADRFRGAFLRHLGSTESIYACTGVELPAALESGWNHLCGEIQAEPPAAPDRGG